MPADDAEVLRRAEELYHAWTLLDETKPSRPPLTFSDLVAFVSDGKPLTHEQQRALFASPTLRTHYDCLKHDFAVPLPSSPAQSRDDGDTANPSIRVLAMPALV